MLGVTNRRTVSRDGSLQLRRLSNTLTLLALFRLLGDLRRVVGVVVGKSGLLARRLVLALGFLAGIRLRQLVQRI